MGGVTVELTVLGVSGSYGSPTAGSACSGYLVRVGATTVWIDAGNGTFPNLQEHVDVADLTAVVISHAHPDHCVDLFGLHVLARYGLGRAGIPVYAPPGVREHLGGLVRGWGDTFDWHEVGDGDSVDVSGTDTPDRDASDPARSTPDRGLLRLAFSRTDHPPETLAVEVTAGDRRMIYTSDTGPGWEVGAFDPGADLVLSEASYLHAQRHTSFHLSAREAGEGARAAAARELMLTHLWPDVDPVAAVSEAEMAFGGPVSLAAPHIVVRV